MGMENYPRGYKPARKSRLRRDSCIQGSHSRRRQSVCYYVKKRYVQGKQTAVSIFFNISTFSKRLLQTNKIKIQGYLVTANRFLLKPFLVISAHLYACARVYTCLHMYTCLHLHELINIFTCTYIYTYKYM